MKKEIFTFTGDTGFELRGVVWSPETEPKAVLQITHGMTEHIGRYAALASELAEHGIVTAGFDLRGHGTNPGDPMCASFGENGWEKSLSDMHLCHMTLQNRFPQCMHVMLGFSLGSFLLREYISRYPDESAGAAILGTGCQPGAVLSLMMAVVRSQIKKDGFDLTTPLVRKLSFETYNQKFSPNRTAADWLCADVSELDAYLADPLCRADISSGLFLQLLGSMKRTGGKAAYDNWNKLLPVLLLSGQSDPVGSMGKGVETVKRAMERAGLQNVQLHLLPGARHDVLHEEHSGSAAQARKIILGWILALIS